MHLLNKLKTKIPNLSVFFKKNILLINDPKSRHTIKLLGVLILPFFGLFLFTIKSFLQNPEYRFVSMIMTLITLSLVFSCTFHPKALGLLSYFFRSAFNDKYVQYLFSLCVKVEIFMNLPFVALKVIWFSFLVVFFFWLFESLDHSYFCFLNISYASFTIGLIYYRLRASFFNADSLGIQVNQVITFGQSFSFLERSLRLDGSCAKSVSLRGPFSSKLSSRTNDLIMPFLIQTRGVSTKAVAEVAAQAANQVVTTHSETFLKISIAAVAAIFGTAGKLAIDNYICDKQIAATIAIEQFKINAQAELSERDITFKTESQIRKSLDAIDQSLIDQNKLWFPNREYLKTLEEDKLYNRSFLTKPTTSVPLEKEIDLSELRGSLVKKMLSKEGFLKSSPSSENLAAGSNTFVSVSQQTQSVLNSELLTSTTSDLIPLSLYLVKDSIGKSSMLPVIYEMLKFWL